MLTLLSEGKYSEIRSLYAPAFAVGNNNSLGNDLSQAGLISMEKGIHLLKNSPAPERVGLLT